MRAAPSVSVVIASFDYADFVGAAIDSALAQDYPDVEVVVIDDGSTDGSVEVIRSYGDRIRWHAVDHQGQSATYSRGVAASTGKIVCMLDCDDIFHPSKVSRVVQALAQHPEAVACFHARTRKYPDGRKVPVALGREGAVDARGDIARGRPPFIATTMSGLSFPRDTLDILMPLPSAPGTGVQDHALKWGALALGPVVFLDVPLATQLIHGANASETQQVGDVVDLLLFNALYLRERFPNLPALPDRLFVEAFTTAVRARKLSPRMRQLARRYVATRPPLTGASLVLRGATGIGRHRYEAG
jgi:glycosyltransferase involved in cell wall biosynthesis